MFAADPDKMLDNLTGANKKIAIIGEMGSGKSRELKRLIYSISQDYNLSSYIFYTCQVRDKCGENVYPKQIDLRGLDFIVLDYSDSTVDLNRNYSWLKDCNIGAVATFIPEENYDKSKLFEIFDYIIETNFQSLKTRKIFTKLED